MFRSSTKYTFEHVPRVAAVPGSQLTKVQVACRLAVNAGVDCFRSDGRPRKADVPSRAGWGSPLYLAVGGIEIAASLRRLKGEFLHVPIAPGRTAKAKRRRGLDFSRRTLCATHCDVWR